jgi:16S rRNA (cytosine1402-N4)-methyltransferase
MPTNAALRKALTKWLKRSASSVFFDMSMMTAPRPVRGSHRSSREESGKEHEQTSVHQGVMTREVVEWLLPTAGEVVVDATYGAGGHSRALRQAAKIELISLDADPRAAGVIEGNFADLDAILDTLGVSEINKIVFDLGWNMEQLGAGRGFSFLRDEPLVMSYGEHPRSGFTARAILNEWSEKVLADVFFGYGEERYARRIARAVVARRALKPIETTLELVEIIRDAVPPRYRHGRIHPATKTFQALRIAVNDELKALEDGLGAAWRRLAPGGRIAVITFHSIEDRVVKQRFVAFAKKDGTILTKKPLTPGRDELAHNPSARSAKLRVIEKTCTP